MIHKKGATTSTPSRNCALTRRGITLLPSRNSHAYEDAGNPVWYLTTGGLTTPTSYSGTWDVYAGGAQLTAPDGTPGAHKVSTATPMSLTFSDATHGTLTMGSVNIPIVRFQEF